MKYSFCYIHINFKNLIIVFFIRVIFCTFLFSTKTCSKCYTWYFLLIFVSWQLISCQCQPGLGPVLGQSPWQSLALALTSIVLPRPWPCPRHARPRHNTASHTQIGIKHQTSERKNNFFEFKSLKHIL